MSALSTPPRGRAPNAPAGHRTPGRHNDLDHLTPDDRRLIQAATGEDIGVGQTSLDRPLSAFAMQLAVDRSKGLLPADVLVSLSYLLRTSERIAALKVPGNPFTGAVLDRALDYVAARRR